MPAMRHLLLLSLALAACGDSSNKTVDAAPADMAIDARPVLPLTPQAYCDTIGTACTGANAQYASSMACLAAAAAFTPGAASTETSGDTLGCRIYHAQNAMISNDPTTHCPHAGPIGAKVDAATGVCSASPCAAFCALDNKLCGTDAAPVTGVTNRYTTNAACLTACANFDKTVQFNSSTTTGPTFACRVFHLENVAIYTAMAMPNLVNAHCGHTLAVGTDPTILGPCK
jgi:hypothetical protein